MILAYYEKFFKGQSRLTARRRFCELCSKLWTNRAQKSLIAQKFELAIEEWHHAALEAGESCGSVDQNDRARFDVFEECCKAVCRTNCVPSSDYVRMLLELSKPEGQNLFLDLLSCIVNDDMAIDVKMAWHRLFHDAVEVTKSKNRMFASCMSLFNDHYDNGDYDAAVKYGEMAMDHARSISEKFRVFSSLGSAYEKLDRYYDSIDYYVSCMKYVDKEDTESRLGVLGSLGNCYLSTGKLDEAAKHYTEAQHLALNRGDKVTVLRLKINLAAVTRAGSRYDEAISALTMCVEEAKKLGNREQLVNAMCSLGVNHSRLGHNSEALAIYSECLPHAGPHDRCILLGNLAGCYIDGGDIDKAKEYLDEALLLARGPSDMLRIHGIMGTAYLHVHRYMDGEKQLEEALQIAKKIGDVLQQMTCVADLAMGRLNRRAESSDCIAYLDEWDRLAEACGNDHESARVLRMRGELCLRNEEYSTGEEYFIRGLKIAERQGILGLKRTLCGSLGRLCLQRRGPLDEALPYFEESLRLARASNDRHEEMICLYNVGYTYIQKMEYAKAESIARESLKIGLALMGSISLDPTNATTRITRAEELHDPRMLLQMALLYQEKDPRSVIIETERYRAKALVDELGGKSDGPELTMRALESTSDAIVLIFSLNTWLNDYDLLITWMIRGNHVEEYEVKVQDHLKCGLGDFVAELRGKSETGGRSGVLNESGTRGPSDSKWVMERLKALSLMLFNLIEDDLDNELHLIIIPDGPLREIPFAALPMRDGKYLGEKHPISIAPSLLAVELLIRRSVRMRYESMRPVIIGDPRPLPDHMCVLKYAAIEAHEIAKQLGVVEIVKEGAQLDNVVSQLRDASGIIHIAAHGVAAEGCVGYVLDQDPFNSTSDGVRSYLVMSGGAKLTDQMILQLDLRRVDLVVLSACQSGVGLESFDGLIGLARAFMVAGARAVVASLWSVYDDTTKSVMCELYAELLKGTTVSRALQLAIMKQVEARRRGTGDVPVHRYFPWVVYGDGQMTIRI